MIILSSSWNFKDCNSLTGLLPPATERKHPDNRCEVWTHQRLAEARQLQQEVACFYRLIELELSPKFRIEHIIYSDRSKWSTKSFHCLSFMGLLTPSAEAGILDSSRARFRRWVEDTGTALLHTVALERYFSRNWVNGLTVLFTPIYPTQPRAPLRVRSAKTVKMHICLRLWSLGPMFSQVDPKWIQKTRPPPRLCSCVQQDMNSICHFFWVMNMVIQ